jgi:hypothetical protein
MRETRNRKKRMFCPQSVFQPLEDPVLLDADVALRAPPGIRKVFKRGSGRNTCFRVSLRRVVCIRTLEALPAVHIFSCHEARFAFIRIKPVFGERPDEWDTRKVLLSSLPANL